MDLRNKNPNKKKARFSITEITNQDFSKFLNKFKNSPYLVYKSKQVYNEPTEAWLFLIKQITKLMKIKRHIWTNYFTLGVNETIGHVNKAIQYEESESNTKMTTYTDKYKQTSSAYGMKGKENTSNTSKKKENTQGGYVCIYEYEKICISTFERACTAQETTNSKIKQMLESLNSETKKLRATNQDLRTYIHSAKKESAAYP